MDTSVFLAIDEAIKELVVELAPDVHYVAK